MNKGIKYSLKGLMSANTEKHRILWDSSRFTNLEGLYKLVKSANIQIGTDIFEPIARKTKDRVITWR